MSERPPEANDPTSAGARVAVVMVNWNGWQDTLEAYESLKQSTFTDWEVICVDNASADDSLAMLRPERPGFLLIESRENLGFAGGCNLAITAAKQRGCQYVYLLNNDATVTEDTLQRLVQASETLDDKSLLGTVIRYPEDGTLQFWGSRQAEDGLPIFSPPNEEKLAASPELIPTDFVLGASLFIPMAALDRVGPLEHQYFLNYEETDWCYRARRAGFDCFMLRDALVWHRGGGAIGHPEGPLQIYFMRRNRLLFCERNVPRGRFTVIYLRQTVGAFFRLLGSMFSRGPRADLLVTRAHVMGTFDYTLRRFGDCPAVIRKMATEYRALTKS